MWGDGSAESAATCLYTASWLLTCELGAKNISSLCQLHTGLVPDPACTLWVCLTPCHPALPSLVTVTRSTWKGRTLASLSLT